VVAGHLQARDQRIRSSIGSMIMGKRLLRQSRRQAALA